MSDRPDPIDRLRAALDPSLIAAVSRLPAPDREALLLVAWGDLTQEQTAKTLGVSCATVRARIARARARLQDPSGGADGDPTRISRATDA